MWQSWATGAVGQEFLTVLAERKFPIDNLLLLASARTPEKKSNSAARRHTVQELTKDSFKGVKIAFFSAGGSISREFAPAAVAAGAVVVDNTSAFRMKQGVPLVVPEVNPEQIHKHNGLIANPNCCTIIMNVPVWPLHKANRVRRIIVSTYQAVSGAGAAGLHELERRSRPMPPVQPSSDASSPIRSSTISSATTPRSPTNGYNEEENKMVQRNAEDLRRSEKSWSPPPASASRSRAPTANRSISNSRGR